MTANQNSRENISWVQLVSILFVSKYFLLLNSSSSKEVDFYSTIIAMCISFAILLLVSIYISKLSENQISILKVLKSNTSKIILMLILILQGAYTLYEFVDFLVYFEIITMSKYILIFIILVTAVYMASQGIEAMGRVCFILAIVSILFIVFILSCSLTVSKLDYLSESVNINVSDIGTGIISGLSSSTEIIIFAIFADKIKNQGKKGIVVYNIFSFFLMILIAFAIIFSFGIGFTMSRYYPVHSLTMLTETVISQRLDDVNAIIWIFVALVRLVLIILASKEILIKFIGENQLKSRFIIGASILVLTLQAVALNLSDDVINIVSLLPILGLAIVFIGVINYKKVKR